MVSSVVGFDNVDDFVTEIDRSVANVDIDIVGDIIRLQRFSRPRRAATGGATLWLFSGFVDVYNVSQGNNNVLEMFTFAYAETFGQDNRQKSHDACAAKEAVIRAKITEHGLAEYAGFFPEVVESWVLAR